MTDSIHPENEEIIQNENEELNTSAIADTDEVLETDDSYTDEPSAYDNIEELTEETDETVEEIIEETTDEEIIEELNPDDEEPPEKNNSFFLALKTLVAKGIYEFSKLTKRKEISMLPYIP